MENEFGYFSKDVASELDITTSSLRRWSIALEKEGYIFYRNENEQRIYFEQDFKAFRELKKLLSNSVPFTDAIRAIASTDFKNKNARQTPSVHSKTIRLSECELQKIIKNEIEKERETLLDLFQEKLNNTLEIRDRILMQQMKNSLDENKKLVIAATKESNKSWWRRLIKKIIKFEQSDKKYLRF